MNGSRTIRVLKRDGRTEALDLSKLAAAMWRAMCSITPGSARGVTPASGRYRDALDLADAIGIYLRRTNRTCVSSAAIFEMTLKVLRRVRLSDAADARTSWHVSDTTARIVAAELESDLLGDGERTMERTEVIDRLNVRIAELGLADAVPVE